MVRLPDIYSYKYGLAASKNYSNTESSTLSDEMAYETFASTRYESSGVMNNKPKLTMYGTHLQLPELVGENTFIINKIAIANTDKVRLPLSRESHSMWSSLTSARTDQSSKLTTSSVSEIETLLDFDRINRRALKCTKYNEIGNPHSRKRKNHKKANDSHGLKQTWSWSQSYNLGQLSSNSKPKHSSNFMDRNSHSLYNSMEQDKINSFLSVRSSILALVQPLNRISLVDSIKEKLEATGKELNQSKVSRPAKMHMNVPTVTMSLSQRVC